MIYNEIHTCRTIEMCQGGKRQKTKDYCLKGNFDLSLNFKIVSDLRI